MARRMLREDQWERIEQLLPGKVSVASRPRTIGTSSKRCCGSGVRGVRGAICPSHLVGHWHRTFVRFSRWRKKGVWERVATALCDDADMEHLFLDSTIVRAHRHSAGAQKSRPSGNRPLTGWIDHQAACGCGFPGQSAASHSHGRSGLRHRASGRTDQRSARPVHHRRQGLRLGCLRRNHHGTRPPGGHPASLQPTQSACVRSAYLQESPSDRALLQPYQAVQTHRHALRQTRPAVPVVRSRLCFRLVGRIENTP